MAKLTREEIGAKLRALGEGDVYVYFQAPSRISYPCFIYSRAIGRTTRADNIRYGYAEGYDVLFITSDPDTEVPFMIMNAFQYCSDGKPYVKDNLYHYPFMIYNR